MQACPWPAAHGAETKSVIHIGFLDYTLFEDHPEFYATYKLKNVKNNHLYSDRLTLSVVNLTRTDLATEEDRKSRLDYWAALFKAATWEEIKMLAKKDQYLNEAAAAIFCLSADEQVRKRCRDREEYYQDLRNYERAIARKDALIADQAGKIVSLSGEITNQANEIASLKAQLERYKNK